MRVVRGINFCRQGHFHVWICSICIWGIHCGRQGHSYCLESRVVRGINFCRQGHFHVLVIGFEFGALKFVDRGIFMSASLDVNFEFGALKFVDRGIFMFASLYMLILNLGH